MDLAGKYEKTNLIGDGEVQVWRGREKARGTQILLHQFTGSPRLLRLAVEYLLTKPPSSPLLEIGELPGGSFLVTTYDLGLLDVTAWLEAAVLINRTAPSPYSPPSAPPPASVSPEPMKLSTGPFPVAAPPVSPPAAVPGPLANSGSVPKSGPGEFTRAFQIPSAPASSPRSENRPETPSGSGAFNKPSGTPGEFTQLFQAPGQSGDRGSLRTPAFGTPVPPPENPSSAPRPAGEFTRLFRPPSDVPSTPWAPPSGGSSGNLSASGPLQQKSPSPEPPKGGISSGALPIPERSAPPPPAGPGEYTRVMQAPTAQSLAQQSPAPPVPSTALPSPALAQAVQLPAVPAAPTIPSAPGFQPPSVPQVQVPSVPAVNVQTPAPATSEPRPGASPIIFLFGALVLVALALVLIFALRK